MKEILNYITKFTGADTDDFQLWQQKVLMYLSTKDLETFVDQDPPDDADNEFCGTIKRRNQLYVAAFMTR